MRQIRSKLGYTQHSFAPLLGLIPSTYEKYERGLHKLPPGLLEQAQQLETTPKSEAASPDGKDLAEADVVLASPLEAETASTTPHPSTNGAAPRDAIPNAQSVGAPRDVSCGASPSPFPLEGETQRSLGETRYERWVQACWNAQLAVSLFIIARIAAIELGWTTA